MSDLQVVRVPLTEEEMAALEVTAKKNCRQDYEQIRFVLRNYLIWAGELSNDQPIMQPTNLLESMQIIKC